MIGRMVRALLRGKLQVHILGLHLVVEPLQRRYHLRSRMLGTTYKGKW